MNCLSLPQRIGLTQTAAERHRCPEDKQFLLRTEANVPPCQGTAKWWAPLRQALGMGEHLGWPLLRALRVDAEMTKRSVSEVEPMYTVQFSINLCVSNFLGSHTLAPARCDGSLSQGERAYRCGLGNPGLSLDIGHRR